MQQQCEKRVWGFKPVLRRCVHAGNRSAAMDSNVGSHIKYEAAKFSLGLGLGLGLGAGGAAEPVVEAPALARFNNMTTAFADKAVEALVSVSSLPCRVCVSSGCRAERSS